MVHVTYALRSPALGRVRDSTKKTMPIMWGKEMTMDKEHANYLESLKDPTMDRVKFRNQLLIALTLVNPHSCTCGGCIRDKDRAIRLILFIEDFGV